MSNPTKEQQKILDNDKKRLIVSASAGSGKTFIVVEYIINLIVKQKIPVSRLLVMTFTKAAANEMKNRLFKAILKEKSTLFLLEQLDEISISDICTIDAFCEKIIKRYINKLDVDENFRVLDEKESKSLKYLAFNRVFEEYSQKDIFNEIYFSFKHNKNDIFDCVDYLQNYFDSQSDGENLINEYLDNFTNYFENSLIYLNSVLKSIIYRAQTKLNEIRREELSEPYQKFYEQLRNICSINLYTNFYENCKVINCISFPIVPRNKTEMVEEKKKLVEARDILKEMINVTGDFKDIDSEDIESLYEGKLAKGILLLTKDFMKKYNEIKLGVDGLDFSDLEKLTKKLLYDKEVLESLQKNYDYIFIDEYQDTNALQETIIKPIAEDGNFIAVGDIKQGIYGFRNASMEIMQKDIDDFTLSKDGQALFLTGNFRSDNRVLSFVNTVFNKIMTSESVGIDYKKNHELKGLVEFKMSSLPSISLDVILKEDSENFVPKKVYSVKDDNIDNSYKYKKEVITLAHRIEELLQNEIYDAKQENFRKVKPNDIAVLFRSRDNVMKESVRYLQEKGFPVFADLKQDLTEDSQVLIILSLIKISLNFKDDISLTSVLSSWFGGYTYEELSQLRVTNPSKSFWEIIEENNDEKLLKFKEQLEDFKFDSQILGLTKALNKLFNKTNYNMYLNSLSDKNTKIFHLQELFKLIAQNNFEYNLPGLVSYLENIDSSSAVLSTSTNTITITTIHATKGLEYPIVILAGCGEKISKVYRRPYIVTSKFGLGCYLFNYQDNLRLVSPPFLAGKYYKKRQEFVDELMILYVAMTRAQNHLYIIGTTSKENISKDKELVSCESYLDFISYSLGNNFIEQLMTQQQILTENYRYSIIDEVEEVEEQNIKEQADFNSTISSKIEDIKKYIDFAYPNSNICKINYKNSVSGMLNLENDIAPNFENKNKTTREQAIKRGNAYHQALKLLEFEKIKDKDSLHINLNVIKDFLEEGYYELLDEDILYRDVMLIKSVAKGLIQKEHEFIMKAKLSEVLEIKSEKEIIIQGIIDLFSLGEENILIDYKYTSIKNDIMLLNHYKKQLDLYAKAIEEAYDIKLDNIYLLSLGDGRLIKYDRELNLHNERHEKTKL